MNPNPKWIVFDLDQTIGCFDSIHPFLIVFFPDLLQYVYRRPHYKGELFPVLNISVENKKLLATAFSEFVKYATLDEKENRLLRPGIVHIIALLLQAKKKGLVKDMIIYSNNANRYNLYFAHEMLKLLLNVKEDIFSQLVDWWHPLRNAEARPRMVKEPALIATGPKTILTIRKAFGNMDISTEDIIFFDDSNHPHVKRQIPEKNYFNVQAYFSSGNLNNLHNAMLRALMAYDLDRNISLLDEYKKIGLHIGVTEEDIESFRMTNIRPTNVPTDFDEINGRLYEIFHMNARAIIIPQTKIQFRNINLKGGSFRKKRQTRKKILKIRKTRK